MLKKNKIRIVADDKIPFLQGVFSDVADVKFMRGDQISGNDLKEVDALLTRTRTKCNAQLLSGTGVKFIATATIGFDHIDTDYCTNAGIQWRNAPGCNSSSVEQYIVSALLKLSCEKKISLNGKVLGVIGVGNVGTKVANAAEALGMKVLRNDPPRCRKEGAEGFCSLDTILRDADFISFHVPMNKEGMDKTYHLADKDFIFNTKKGVILINSSRGGVVDEKAIAQAIREDRIGGVVLDVWEDEPRLNKEFVDRITISTPHIAGYSVDGKANGTRMAVHAISDFFDLGLENWSPENLPGPNPVLNSTIGDAEDYVQNLYWETYNIDKDDSDLRNQLQGFEKLRGNYRVRREPSYYYLSNDSAIPDSAKMLLQKLGFQSKQSSK